MSPEMLKESYTKPTDMWSIGCIAYYILSGKPAFDYKYDKQLFLKIKLGSIDFDIPEFKGISNEAKNFLTVLLLNNPKDRYTADEALDHAWFKLNKNEKLES